jgi:hypothetical protein
MRKEALVASFKAHQIPDYPSYINWTEGQSDNTEDDGKYLLNL